MIALILCFLMNVGIFSLFNIFPKYNINTFQAITINYFVCIITGIIFIGSLEPVLADEFQPWMGIAFGLGGVFIGTFYLMAITTQRYGISVSTIANKESLVIPVIFALFIFDIESREFNMLNYAGLVLALPAIYLSSYRSEDREVISKTKGYSWLILPFLIFILGGLIDTAYNFTNYRFLTPAQAPVFPVYLFFSASLIGLFVILIKRNRISKPTILGGILLGIINYFSVYLILEALSAFNNDGAIVYPVLNMLIILGSAFVSVLVFRDKLEIRNKAGVLMSLVSIFLIFHQEILNFL